MLFGNKKKSKGIESFNPELCKIEKSKKEGLRYYLVGDETVVCPIHVMNLDFQGDNIVRTGGYVGNIEDKISRLRHKFCK